MDIAKRIADLRRKKKYTQQRIADYLGISRGAYANYEVGSREPDADTLARLAELYEVTTDYLITGAEPHRNSVDHPVLSERPQSVSNDKNPYALTPKDERDIAREVERIMSSLDSDNALAFDGEPLTDEDRRLLRISLENSLRMTREMAKKKFTPKKYRKHD